MANTVYLGNNVGGVVNMPFSGQYFPNSKTLLKAFEKDFLLSNVLNKYKYLFAITADKRQYEARQYFIKHGFRDVKYFYSSHGGAKANDETLTLWVKINEKYDSDLRKKEDKDEGEAITTYANCTVNYGRENDYVCQITSKGPADTIKSLKNLGFSRVKNTNIWFKIKKDKLVGKKDIDRVKKKWENLAAGKVK